MKLFYRKFGEGPPLIILHGLYGSSDNWLTAARSLSGDYTVYLPDQRNHGQSPHSEIHDYDSMRDDLFELTNDLKLRKIFLAGHSMGGKTAMSFAIKWPEMINGLLIEDISPFVNKNTKSTYNKHLTIINSILSIDLSRISSRGEAESQLIEKIPEENVRRFILKNLQRTEGNIFTWKLNALSLRSNLEKIMEGIELGEGYINPVTGFPVIFLKGKNSDFLTTDDMKNIQKVFPASEFIEIAGAAHWIHADRLDEVIKNLKKLLKSN